MTLIGAIDEKFLIAWGLILHPRPIPALSITVTSSKMSVIFNS